MTARTILVIGAAGATWMMEPFDRREIQQKTGVRSLSGGGRDQRQRLEVIGRQSARLCFFELGVFEFSLPGASGDFGESLTARFIAVSAHEFWRPHETVSR
ncbi:MAG: hypothetical protein ACK4IT_01975 [Thioalkalivibrionaceae bacterium]